MGVVVVCAVFGGGLVAAFVWTQWEKRRADRAAAAAARESAARFEERRAETAAAMGRSAERVDADPRVRRFRGLPESLDEAQVVEDANRLIAAATRMCRRDAEVRENTALMNRYASQYPMKQRPSLVERAAESDNNPQVETS